ncbi:hypothetical protein ABIC75_003083 [Dyella japonica]|uniref:Uncharacterized protein n=1 Tax=Dyella japonica TaxID=231455 RepID=A0ABV2JWY8_9GAMM
MTRLPSVGRKVRVRAPGFFDRTSLSCRKTGRIPAATLRAFLHPPAAVIRGPQEQEPKLAAVVFSRAPAPHPGLLPGGEKEKWGARRGRKSEAKARADAKRGSALSPLRFGRVAQRLEVPAAWPPMGVPPQPSSSVRAYPSTMLPALALQAIFFGLLFFWASKRKVTRAAAADRNARRVGGKVTEALQKNSQRCRDNQPSAKSLDDQPSAVEKRLLPPQE